MDLLEKQAQLRQALLNEINDDTVLEDEDEVEYDDDDDDLIRIEQDDSDPDEYEEDHG